MNKQSITTTLLRQLESKPATAFFINGPPGAGKTYLLNEFAESLPAYLSNTQVLGPYRTLQDTVHITKDLQEFGYLSMPAPEDCREDWYSTWIWLRDNLKVSTRQNFIILIRLDDKLFAQFEELRVWFSSLRYMEHYWNNHKIRLLFVVAGYWNHMALEEYYRTIQLSFPYTTSTNYTVWNKISEDDAVNLVKRKLEGVLLAESFGRLMYEITGGLVGALIDILACLESSNPGVSDILIATQKAVEKGYYAKTLVESWRGYPVAFTQSINQLLLYKKFSMSDKNAIDLLRTAGIVSSQEVLGKTFIQVSSWYIELLLRSYASVLGISNEGWGKVQFNEFTLGLTTFNVEAYKVINSIENLIRNFAIARLCEQDDYTDHILQNRVLRRKKSYVTSGDDDVYTRAAEWKERSKHYRMNTTFNPLIAYVSTGDLVQLVREIAVAGDGFWNDIVNAIDKITPIRDAVMHHQMIDEKSLESLYSLQMKIYSALNR
jgi:hypothetical protein